MHAMQTSGNCIRNVTADHYAGAAIDEIEDPRIWCEIVRQWSTLWGPATQAAGITSTSAPASTRERASSGKRRS